MLAMSKLAALAAAGDSLSSAAALKADALRVRDCRLAMMSVQARSQAMKVQSFAHSCGQGLLTCSLGGIQQHHMLTLRRPSVAWQ